MRRLDQLSKEQDWMTIYLATARNKVAKVLRAINQSIWCSMRWAHCLECAIQRSLAKFLTRCLCLRSKLIARRRRKGRSGGRRRIHGHLEAAQVRVRELLRGKDTRLNRGSFNRSSSNKLRKAILWLLLHRNESSHEAWQRKFSAYKKGAEARRSDAFGPNRDS